jgi:hypothetical protein
VSKLESEILALKGKLWILLSHSVRMDTGELSEDIAISALLNGGGTIIKSHKVTGSSCYLVDTGR